MEYSLPPSMGLTGELRLTNVRTSSMPILFEALDALYRTAGQPYKVYVHGKGATRKGEVVYFNTGEMHELVDRNVTHRKVFFNIDIDGVCTLIRPEQNLFSAVNVRFE